MSKKQASKSSRFGGRFRAIFGRYYSNDAKILLSGFFVQNLSTFESKIVLFLQKITYALIAQEASV